MYKEFKDYYKTLQVDFTASDADIKVSYRKLAREYHPDLHPDETERYTAIFQELTEAYETLSDTVKKMDYDYKYRSVVLQEQPVYAYYYDDTPEDTRVYEHKYTRRARRRFNYYPLIALGILLFQVMRMVTDMAPVADLNRQRSVMSQPPPGPREIQQMIRQSADSPAGRTMPFQR